MTVSQLINEILSEWAYRVNDGMPNPKNPTHLNELGIVLSEMGLSHIKTDLVKNLLGEAEDKFKNPVLNKTVRYKNTKGEDAEGVVGDMLRLAKDHPGRIAAEKMLPPEGSEERDSINKDLGGEGQPKKPEDEKGKEGEDKKAGKEEKIKQAQAMFDPNVDPAMAARLDKEKETQAKLAADTEKQKQPETPANQKTNKELAKAAGFDDVGSWYNDLNKKAMSDDPEVSSQAQKDLDTYEKNKVKDAQAAQSPEQPSEPETSAEPKKPEAKPDAPKAEKPEKNKKIGKKQKMVSDADEVEDIGPSEKFPKQTHLGGGYYTEEGSDKPTSKFVDGKLVPLSQNEKDFIEANNINPRTLGMIDKAAKTQGIDIEKAINSFNLTDEEKQKLIPFYKKKGIQQNLKNRKSEDGEPLDLETTNKGSMIIGIEHGEGKQSNAETIKQIQSLPKDTKVMFVGEGGMSKDNQGNIEFGGEQAEMRDAVKSHFTDSKESSWDENANISDDNSPVFGEVGKVLGNSKSKSKAAIYSNMVGQGDDLNANDYLDDEGKAWLVDQAKKGGSKEFEGDVDWNNLTDGQKNDLYQLNYRDDDNFGETEISKAQQAYNDYRQSELDRKIKEAEDEGYTVIAPVGNSHVDAWRKRNKGEGPKPKPIGKTGPEGGPDAEPPANEPDRPDTTPKDGEAETPAKPEAPKAGPPPMPKLPPKVEPKKGEEPKAAEPKAEPETPSAEKPKDKKEKEDIKDEEPGKEATSSSGKKIYSVGGGYYSDKPNGPAKYVRTENIVDLAFAGILIEETFALFEKTISATLANGEKITVQELPPRAVKKATQRARAAAQSKKSEKPAQQTQLAKGEEPKKKPDVVIPGEKPGTIVKKSDGKPDVVLPGKEKPKAKTPPPPPPPPPKKPAVPPPPPPKKSEKPPIGEPQGEYKPDPNLKPEKDKEGNVPNTDIPVENEENPNPAFVKKVSTKMDDFYLDVLKEEGRAQEAVIEQMKKEGKLPEDFKAVNPRDMGFGFKHPALKDNPDVQKELADRIKKENKPPHWDLCKVSIPGTNKFCDDNIGIPREKMPQLGGKPKPGSMGDKKAKKIADQNVRKKMGLPEEGEIPSEKQKEYDDLFAREKTDHVNVEKEFEEYLASEGIKVSEPIAVPASSLKATQNELVGEQVVGMVAALEEDPNNPFITAPIMVTRDGYVIDGHHRWATVQAYNMKHCPPNGPKPCIEMKVRVVDEDIDTHIPRANKFADDYGIEKMSGKAKGEPSSPTSAPRPFLQKVKDKIKKLNQEEKEFFNNGYYKPGSDARRSIGETIKDKAAGAWKAIKKGFKHEVEEFKTAGKGIGKFFKGEKLDEHETKALKGVAIKVVTTALFGALTGGLSAGAGAFAKHVAIEFVPHVVGETLLKGAGRAAIFADGDGDAEMEANLQKFIEMVADGVANMNISAKQMDAMLDSYNQKKEKEMKSESLIEELINEITLEANPIKKADDVLNQMVKYKDEKGGDHEIKVATALKYKDSQNKGQLQAYKAAVGLLKKAGVSDKELGIEKPKQVKGAGLGFRKTGEKELDKPKTQPTSTKPTKGSRIIGGKDKTLQKIDTLKSKEFTQKQIPDDSKFEVKNKKNKVGPPPPPYKLPKELYAGSKVPPRHLKALERMMNTKANNETAKWSYFSDLPGGAGQISAQAGELMTMVSTTLDDKQAQSFFDSLIKHEEAQIKANPDLKIEGKRIVTKSWIQAAMNNRKAIRNRLAKEYPGAQIVAGSWDTEGEVEAMGLKDYKKNKGFSTDAYFKIKTKDGQEILDEVSLKKSTAVNFLNSGTGKLSEWDPNISDDINPIVYQKNQRKALYLFGSKNLANLKKLVAKDPEFQELIKSKKIDLETAIKKLEAGKGSRDINKVVLSAIATAAKKGDKASQKYIQYVQDTHKAHQKAVISSLGNNPKLKQGMLTAIREEFPLKAVGEGEESMAIGPNSLDRAVLQNIFETSNFEQIKQGLFAVTNEEPPYLAYQAGPKGKVIPIATIVAREDGVGYGGQIKFEMQLDRRFAKILEQANKNIYG